MKEATGESIHPALVDIGSFVEENPSAESWMDWFRGDGDPLSAGSAYGDIKDAPEMAQYIQEHQNTQIGLQNVEFNGRQLKLVLSRNGWIAVYEPKEMDTIEFSQFVRKKVLPYVNPNQ
ncbi:hypothetical protein [Natronorubrum sp. FCH18a]|uniref:hypothetical protein n=1 Tax=Natronorubrum sp. FCH18a TaxID=3447018 RepID=UPI003F50FD07